MNSSTAATLPLAHTSSKNKRTRASLSCADTGASSRPPPPPLRAPCPPPPRRTSGLEPRYLVRTREPPSPCQRAFLYRGYAPYTCCHPEGSGAPTGGLFTVRPRRVILRTSLCGRSQRSPYPECRIAPVRS